MIVPWMDYPNIPLPLAWSKYDCRRAIIYDTDKRRLAELAWVRHVSENDVEVLIDGMKNTFCSDTYHVCYFTFQNLGAGFLRVGIQGGAKYQSKIGSIHITAANKLFCRSSLEKGADFVANVDEWEEACLTLFNLYEGRV